MNELVRNAVAESVRLKESFFDAHEEAISQVAREMCRAFESGNKILIFGNGGSATDAQHFAAELVGRFVRERRPLAAIALRPNLILTSVGNDYGYEQVFVRQIRALGRTRDVAIGISTSSNSPNVCVAAATAREMGLVTVAFTGSDGKLGRVAQYHLECAASVGRARPGGPYHDCAHSVRAD